mgnify:CR=1 FL=1
MQSEIKQGKRPRNPLNKRVWRDCLRDWKRYLMIFVMLVVTIGFVSGMYVANNSMMQSLDDGAEKYSREDGHFELSAKAGDALLDAISTGERADVVSAFKERAYSEAAPEVEKAVRDAVTEKVREQVETAIREQVTAAVDEQLAAAEAMGMEVTAEQRESAINEALGSAMSENYESAVSDALEQAFESDDYRSALDEAMTEAKAEIDKEIDKKYDELAERYELKEDADAVPVTIYELFYKEDDETLPSDPSFSGRVRVYSERRTVNMYDILDGSAPRNENEIIIDRMHADNVGIKTGDTVYVGNTSFTVSGLAAFVDYTTLYESNTDTMFDAITFDVAMTTDAGYSRITGAEHANYAFVYADKPDGVYSEKTLSDSFLKVLITQTAASEDNIEIKDYVPAYANHAITFAPQDMGSDKAMGGVLLYILIAVLAFIFAVSISSTLEKEASVIGTLRASGYTKGEMIRYYMSAPLLVVVIASAVGNILGYTAFKEIVVAMYRNSYSLPTYETLWTPDAFIRTTVVPFVLMLLINLFVITRNLRLSPLRFLRHDLKRRKRKKAVRLPKWRFFARFRMRVFLQNIPNYLMLFVGITFVMILLSMAVGMPMTLSYYQDSVKDMMFAEDQIILLSTEDDDGNTITTDTPGAERFSAYSLMHRSDILDEEITVYGIGKGSSYISLDDSYYDDTAEYNQIYVSEAFSEKYNVHAGDVVTLSEKYEDTEYEFTVYGIYDYSAGITAFMSPDRFNEVFGKDEGYFSGYMSDTTITGIDKKYIAKEITSDDMLKLTKQLDHSMGAYMLYFQYMCVIVAAIILYLLTKIIIEKNERAISMVKILGYDNREIAMLYMLTTAIVVLISEIAAIWIGYAVMGVVWKVILMKLGGWFAFVMLPEGFVKEFLLVFIAYLIITVCDFIRIRRIPKVLALKNVE